MAAADNDDDRAEEGEEEEADKEEFSVIPCLVLSSFMVARHGQ